MLLGAIFTVLRNQARQKITVETESIFRTMGLEMQSTDQEERDLLVSELIDELIKQGGHQLWK